MKVRGPRLTSASCASLRLCLWHPSLITTSLCALSFLSVVVFFVPFFVCVLTSLQITSYILSLGSGSGQDYQILYRGPKRTFEAKKLDDGETYSVRVQAVSSYGESEPSTVLTVRTRTGYQPEPLATSEPRDPPVRRWDPNLAPFLGSALAGHSDPVGVMAEYAE